MNKKSWGWSAQKSTLVQKNNVESKETPKAYLDAIARCIANEEVVVDAMVEAMKSIPSKKS